MPFLVKFDTPMQNSPLAAIIPDATPFNDGVMTQVQAAALAALVAGGGAPGEFVPLNYSAGWGNGAGLPVGESRVVGDETEFAGVIQSPVLGGARDTVVANLPVGQRPSVVRVVGCVTTHGNGIVSPFFLLLNTNGDVILGADIASTSPAPSGTSIIIECIRFLR